MYRSQRPRGLRRRSAAVLLLGLWVRIPLRHGCLPLVIVVCCVGSGFCDGLITRPEESYRVYVCLSDYAWSRNLDSEPAYARGGLLRHRKEK
jgi:hypothetical protein